MFSIIKTARFEAAHRLPEYKGICNQLHGHSYKVELEVAGGLNDMGMVYDLSQLGQYLKEVLGKIDHSYLNENEEIYLPWYTAKCLAKWIAENVQEKLQNVTVVRCRVWETETGGAEWRIDECE